MSSLATFASASTPTSSIAPPPVSFYFQVLPPSLNDDDYEGFATLPGESILLMKRNVGLYLGKVRCQDFDDGIVYLTSQRIVYIDIQRPLNKRFALSLAHIERIDGFSGFINSSPKITIHLLKNDHSNSLASQHSNTTAHNTGMDGRSLPTTTTNLLVADNNEWICSVCSCPNTSNNNDGNSNKCRLCGTINRMINDQTTTTEGMVEPNEASAMDSFEVLDGIACPACTFLNHISMMQCELCETMLFNDSTTMTSASRDKQSVRLPNETGISSIKLSFRRGGQPEFMGALSKLLADRALNEQEQENATSDMDRSGGISKILQKIDLHDQTTEKTLSDAFADLNTLMTKASELVSLAESITGKLESSSSSSSSPSPNVDNNGQVTLASLLTQLDIHNPVTKDMAGDSYYEELAREFAGFMIPVLNTKSGMIALPDAYCLFNRARGVELVSPQDLRKACHLCDTMQLPIRVRQFSSGLLAVEPADQNDEAIASRILSEITEHGSVSGVELARSLEISPTLAIEQLLIAEKLGSICREETVHTLRFYANHILSCAWYFNRSDEISS